MRRRLLVVVLASSCARVEESPPRVPEAWEIAGGSRLRPIFVTLPGGVRSFVAFEDRARGERCIVGGVGDVARCTPPTINPVTHGAFADASCTIPAATDNDCWVGTKLFPHEDGTLSTTKSATRLYDGRGGCTPIDYLPPTMTLLQADKPVKVEDFVAFRRERLDVGARLRLNMLIGDDGSRYPAGLYDTTYGTDCRFIPAADGSMRCLPEPTAQYWDATCSSRVTGYRDTPPRVVTGPREGCVHHAFAATDLGRVRLARRDASGACVLTGLESTAVRIDEELPPEAFVLETRERAGDARITQWYRTVGHARLPSTIEDRELGVACSFTLDGGAYRCLPAGLANSVFYEDAECSNPVLCKISLCGDERRYAIDRAGTCSWTVRTIGPARPAPERMFADHLGTCGMVGGGLTCDAISEAGDVVPTERLASGNVVVE